uniref:NEDD4 like E3 ubiquitin protein ligase n=1 Tax=Homo sapiens TaxID=9606 RepID=A0A6Q8PGL4_HUMAN
MATGLGEPVYGLSEDERDRLHKLTYESPNYPENLKNGTLWRIFCFLC